MNLVSGSITTYDVFDSTANNFTVTNAYLTTGTIDHFKGTHLEITNDLKANNVTLNHGELFDFDIRNSRVYDTQIVEESSRFSISFSSSKSFSLIDSKSFSKKLIIND